MHDEAFYTTAAQVIPVLLLALFIEQRLLLPSSLTANQAWHAQRWHFLGYLGLLFFAELTAFVALLDTPSDYSKVVVFVGLGIGFMALAIIPAMTLLSGVSATAIQIGFYVGLAIYAALGQVLGNDATPLAGFIVLVVCAITAFITEARQLRAKHAAEDAEDQPAAEVRENTPKLSDRDRT